ncbi:MAG: LysR family transcriptional regulator [Martelella sp.]|uniref:LysR family transcriptional regulator n=1 Tax=unclassified Martelella TaxID=2629616 RepID=UPI000C6691B5|nr:LysR family transcriptional regulator [Martelella sp.]MAU20527.1 LysR family transcriptional regulator [Martelella sp.]
MNIKQLEVFRAVLSTGSTMGAAKSTGLSQSGVSRLVQQLESDLELTLFQRVKGRLVPTPEARTLEAEAKTVLLNLARFSQLADEIRTGASETEAVRIGLPSSMWENFAPAMLKDYREGFPGVRVETFFETTMTIQRMIDQRVIDFGFLRHEGEISPGIRLEIVAEGRSVAVMHRDHRLAARDVIRPEDLRGEPLIMLGRLRAHRVMLDRLLQNEAVRADVRIETHSNSSACAYAAEGLGIALASSFYANLYKHLPVVQRPFEPKLTQRFGIATAEGVPMSLAAKGLMAALKRQIERSQVDDQA